MAMLGGELNCGWTRLRGDGDGDGDGDGREDGQKLWEHGFVREKLGLNSVSCIRILV